MKVQLKSYQDKFLFSERRYPAMICGIGTGKTMMLLFKVWNFCQKYPNSLALVVRKEYVDLRDSTLKDFELYFNKTVNNDKEYKFDNGSTIMFRHATELNVLKNVNLSIFAVEQAEEFETDEQFQFMRDRLRRKNSPYRQGLLIANANGHNWMWKLWKNNPPSKEYDLVTATTFDNADNLTPDFIEDQRRREVEAPNHYRRMVMNSFEDFEQDDFVFNLKKVLSATELNFDSHSKYQKLLACDIARYGEDENVVTILEGRGPIRWEQTYIESWRDKSLAETTGRILDLRRRFGVSSVAIDGDGMGAGVVDRIRELKAPVMEFRGGMKAGKDTYENLKAEAYFKLQEFVNRGFIKLLPDEKQTDQLMTIRFGFKSNGARFIVSKEKMRKDGIASPDRADALMMAVAFCERAQKLYGRYGHLPREADHQYDPLSVSYH